jgi:hypothetical protein
VSGPCVAVPTAGQRALELTAGVALCSLVITAAAILGVSVNDALEAYGVYFVKHVEQQVGAATPDCRPCGYDGLYAPAHTRTRAPRPPPDPCPPPQTPAGL